MNKFNWAIKKQSISIIYRYISFQRCICTCYLILVLKQPHGLSKICWNFFFILLLPKWKCFSIFFLMYISQNIHNRLIIDCMKSINFPLFAKVILWKTAPYSLKLHLLRRMAQVKRVYLIFMMSIRVRRTREREMTNTTRFHDSK